MWPLFKFTLYFLCHNLCWNMEISCNDFLGESDSLLACARKSQRLIYFYFQYYSCNVTQSYRMISLLAYPGIFVLRLWVCICIYVNYSTDMANSSLNKTKCILGYKITQFKGKERSGCWTQNRIKLHLKVRLFSFSLFVCLLLFSFSKC